MAWRVRAIKLLLISVSIALPAAWTGTVALAADAEGAAENLPGEAEKASAISKLEADIKAAVEKKSNAAKYGDRNAVKQLAADLKLLRLQLNKAKSKPPEKYVEEAAYRKRIEDENARLVAEKERKEAAAKMPKDTNEIKTLTVDQAQALTKREDDLNLNGLTTLSDDVAQVLAKNRYGLWLRGLTTLSPGAAKALAQHKGILNLNGLTTLSDEAAQALGPYTGDLLLNGLTTLSEDAAKGLAQQQKGDVREYLNCLNLNGLTTLSDEAARALAQHKGHSLLLNGLTTLSDKAAKELGQHQGYRLFLDGLPTLSDGAARALARHKGIVFLKGLTALDGKAANALRGKPNVRLPDRFN